MGKAPAQRRQQMAEILHDERGTRIATGPQARAQQQPRAPLEPDERVIHVLVVMPVKERQLLRAMGRIIRAVEIEREIGGMLVGTVGIRTEPVDADAGEAVNLGPLHRILQSRERGLRPERRAAIAGHDLEGGIVTQPVGIVDVLVPGRDLVEALPKQRGNIVSDIPRVAGVCNAADDVGAETELLIELSDEQQARVGCERAPAKSTTSFGWNPNPSWL